MKVITIGRGSGNDVHINDRYVSRHHLQIVQDDYGHYKLVDFGSKNGSYVNGRRVQGEVCLSLDDIVQIGNTTLPWQTYFSRENPQKTITIGRGLDNNVVINDDKVSRIHCRIDLLSNGQYRIVDLGSKNGTYVNGNRVLGESLMSSTDIVRVGNSLLSWKSYFSANGIPPSQTPPPDIKEPGSNEGKTYGFLVFFLGLIALGIDVFLVIKFFTSFANQVALAFGGVGSSIKLFPIYLRGYFGFNGQWGYMIAALVLGIVADFVGEVVDENDTSKDKLKSMGLTLANIAITVSIIFMLLAAFAFKIAENLF